MKKLVLSLLFTTGLSISMIADAQGKIAENGKELHPYAVRTAEGQRYGYIFPQNGVWSIPPSYEQAFPFAENGLAKVMKDGKFGVINTKGEFVVNPVYQMISPFQDGMAMVQTEEDWGFVNEQGGFASMPAEVASSQLFSEGFAGIEIDGYWGFLNQQGQVAIAPKFDSVYEFAAGLAAVVKQEKWGYVNKAGNLVMEPELDTKPVFYGGYAAAVRDGKWGYVSPAGSWAVNPRFESALGFFGGLAAVKEQGKWGFIDSSGTMVIEPQFDGAASFDQKLAPVKIGQQWGYINKQGHIVIAPQFDRAAVFNGELAAVSIKGRWGFINRQGELAVQPQYEDVRLWEVPLKEPRHWIYWVRAAGKSGLLAKNGSILQPLVFDEIKQLSFKEPDLEYIAVSQNQKYGILNMQGEWVIKTSLWRLPDTVYMTAKVAVLSGDFYDADGSKIQRHYANFMADGYRFWLNLQYEEAVAAFRAAMQINPQDQAAGWAIDQIIAGQKSEK